MRNLSFIGLVAALLIVGVVMRRQLLATRQLAPAPVSAPVANPAGSANQSDSATIRQRSQTAPAAIAASVQNALDEAMREHEQRLHALDDAQDQ